MNIKLYNLLLLLFLVFLLPSFISKINAQEVTNSAVKSDEKSGIEKPSSSQAAGNVIQFKNETGNAIITITDEGTNKGSITLPQMTSNPSSTDNKLYNLNSSLYFEGVSLSGASSIDGLSDGKSTTGSNSVYLGTNSGLNDDSQIGTETEISYNTAVGVSALRKNGQSATPFGVKNTAIGFEALRYLDNNTADENTAVGYQAHLNNENGYQSTALGAQSMLNYTGGYGNIAVGYQALKGGSGANGQYNVALGYGALADNTTGNKNVAIGYKAGETHTGSNELFIHNNNNGVATPPLIWGRFAPGTIRVQINDEDAITTNMFYVNGSAGGTSSWSSSSDERLKKNISTITNSLEKVKKLRGVNFEWKDPKNHREGLQMGFIAQEANEIIPEVVDDVSEYMSMEYAPITALLVEAVKEQNTEFKNQNEELKKRLTELEQQNSELRIQNTVVGSKNLELENRILNIEKLISTTKFANVTK
ncbi:MAG: tail fiber domain-containing protein [Melioribacteraceae bacterium]